MDNLLSYCGLVDTRISTFNKDLPVQGLVAKLEEAHPSALCLGVVSGHGAVVVQDLPVRAPHELDGLGRVDAAW